MNAVFAAKIAGVLVDLGIDVKRIGPEAAAVLFKIEKDAYGKETPHEAALWFLFQHIMTLPREAYLLPIELEDLLERAKIIVRAWAKSGKLTAAEADRNVATFQMQIEMHRTRVVMAPGKQV